MENIPTTEGFNRREAWKAYLKRYKKTTADDRERDRAGSPSPPISTPSEPLAERAVVPSGSGSLLRSGIHKSRTFNALSNLGHSISRASSLSRATDRSRDVSVSSSTRHPTPIPKRPRLSISSRFGRKSLEPSLELETDKEGEWRDGGARDSARVSIIPKDPRLVTSAMPPQYWTGRFVSLHDQFHGELLETTNLDAIIDAQVAQSSICGDDNRSSVPPAGALNNPSISVYGATRLPRQSLDARLPTGQQGRQANNGRAGRFSRIPQSATSNVVLDQHHRGVFSTVTTTMQLSLTSYPRRVPFSQPSSRLPSYDEAVAMPAPLSVTHRPKSPRDARREGTRGPDHSRDVGVERAVAMANAAVLTDDDSRCRRVLAHLKGSCLTDEAVQSLYVWQLEFARHTGRESLLPPGGTMEDARRKTLGGIAVRLEGLLGRSDTGKSLGSGGRPSPQPPPLPKMPRHVGLGALKGSRTGLGHDSEVRKAKRLAMFTLFG